MHPHGPWRSGIAILEDNVFKKKLLPENSPLAEKRKDTRVSVNVPFRYRVIQKKESPSGGKSDASQLKSSKIWKPAESVDLSNSGLRITLNQPLPMGAQVELDVHLPKTSESVHLEGRVVWVKQLAEVTTTGYECGVAFENLRRITKKERLIQFFADRLCEIAIKYAPQNLLARPAETVDELKGAFRIIYNEYFSRGYCEENPSQMHYSFYCLIPSTKTFLLEREKQILGTLTLIPDSPCGLPIESLFPDPIEELRNKGHKIAEVGLLALDGTMFRPKSFSLTDFEKFTSSFWLFKIMFEYARQIASISDLIIAVHPKHEDLYRYLFFTPIAGPLPYDSACGKPALLMRLDILKTEEDLPGERNLKRFFWGLKVPLEIFQNAFKWDEKSLREFLFSVKAIWNELPPAYQEYLRKTYSDFSLEL